METNHRELIQEGGRIVLQARLRRSLPRLAATVAVAVPAVLFATGSAQAETVPGCSSAFQIGSTASITEAGQTFASVKQFYGCGENWGYIYIWQGWRNTHSSWGMCTAVMDNTTHAEDGLTCGDSQHDQIELWSGGTPTANDCTQAMGVDTDSEAYNYSSQVC
jgi:hypothetical protein